MTAGPPQRIAFLGFGLIAGSMARALAAGRGGDPVPDLVGWSPTNAGPEAAVRDGVLATAATSPAAAIEGADLVVLAAPPLETVGLVEALGGSLRAALPPEAVVTDVASTKAAIVAAADAAGLRFVGGHPMAGREVAGYESSVPDLFAGRPWVLVAGATADAAALDRVAAVVGACGGRPVRMDAATHDAAVAAISHLPLVVSAALAEAVAGAGIERPGWAAAAPLAASGWRDMTRLARGDVRMGAGIAATNPGALARGLHDLRDVLDAWIAELERAGGPDPDRIQARLRAVRERLGGLGSNPPDRP
ncbi:MAG: prephenate dehydrogenase/arogenate dehydrogenase family protein [Chloroflexota bacterium]|nr:MAG: prephenate dehydrogenase/arogenate dehydrogenase family protein [Chloroflexota bacterium]